MADIIPVSPLARVLVAGDHGRPGPGGPGLTFRERGDLCVISLMARPEARAEIANALGELGLSLPGENAAAVHGSHAVLWAALDRWHVLAEESGRSVLDRLRGAVADKAALVDQTAGTCLIELSGPRLEAVLETSTPVDPHALAVNATAATSINHLAVQLWRRAEDTVLIAVPRSFARDLVEFLHTMALEAGYRDVT